MQPHLAPKPEDRPKTVMVLIEDEAPQFVIAELCGEPWVGLASDEDFQSGLVRWLYAPLSSVEREALLRGAVEVAACFRKGRVLVVDEGDGADSLCSIEGSAIPDGALPREGFVLPSIVRPPVAAPVAANEAVVSLARASGASGVNLRSLAAIADAFQRLYAAVAQLVLENKTTNAGTLSSVVQRAAELELASASPGSLILSLRPASRERFDDISARVGDLLGAQTAAEAMEVLGRLGPRVQGRFEDLLDEVLQHDLHMMVTWSNGRSVFAGGEAARQKLAMLPAPQSTEHGVKVVVGILLGLDPGNKTFTLYDINTDETLQGKLWENFVVPGAVTTGQDTPAVLVELGRSKFVTRGGDPVNRFELRRFIGTPQPN